ncbi:MAG: diguanylate cyclase [Bryobacterales bacterium]|nr:diguanylate cyclase [Bryobacterales bacterium]
MRILIAEDDPISRRLLETILGKWGYEVVVAHDGDQAWKHLQGDDAPRLVIADWMMPGLDGIELCQRVRARETPPHYTYLLLLTARSQREDLVQGMEAGADDYVTKPFDANELKVRLRAGRRILELQQQLIEAQEALREQASRDALTGIRNRNAIFELLRLELNRAQRESSDLALVMADIDHFKDLNDTFGHLAGDKVLRESVARMVAMIRPYDAIGRYGGEEFLIILPGCDARAGAQRAESLRLAVCREPFDTSEGRMSVTCSMGVTSTAEVGKTDVDALVRAADAALYRAKNNGRNRVET